MKGRYQRFRDAQAARGLVISAQYAGTIVTQHTPDMLWLVRFAVPFTYAASKNAVWRNLPKRDPVANRRESMAWRAMVAKHVREMVAGRRIAHNRLWIDLLVQKPNHKGDAVNVVDVVCDAIKDATGLDDRWYSLRWVDWEIVKHNPLIFVGIGQDSVEDVQVCASCGRVLPMEMFASNRSSKSGRTRTCHDCRRVR